MKRMVGSTSGSSSSPLSLEQFDRKDEKFCSKLKNHSKEFRPRRRSLWNLWYHARSRARGAFSSTSSSSVSTKTIASSSTLSSSCSSSLSSSSSSSLSSSHESPRNLLSSENKVLRESANESSISKHTRSKSKKKVRNSSFSAVSRTASKRKDERLQQLRSRKSTLRSSLLVVSDIGVESRSWSHVELSRVVSLSSSALVAAENDADDADEREASVSEDDSSISSMESRASSAFDVSSVLASVNQSSNHNTNATQEPSPTVTTAPNTTELKDEDEATLTCCLSSTDAPEGGQIAQCLPPTPKGDVLGHLPRRLDDSCVPLDGQPPPPPPPQQQHI